MSEPLEASEGETQPDFLNAGGLAGSAMRHLDGAGSPLGPPRGWPPALRTVVRMMLNGDVPMFVWWGEESVCLCNDAWVALQGDARASECIGRPAHDVWGDQFEQVRPSLDFVRSGAGSISFPAQASVAGPAGARLPRGGTYSPIDCEGAPAGIGGVVLLGGGTHGPTAASATPRGAGAGGFAPLHGHRPRRDGAAVAGAPNVLALLHESEVRFRAALQAGGMGSWETDYVAQTRRWSEEGMALFGLDLPDGIGQVGGDHDEYITALHPADRHLVAKFREWADTRESFPAEYRIVRDGKVRWLSGGGLVVARDPQGRAVRLVSIMADSTEKKVAESKLATERERLELALGAGGMGAYDLDMTDGSLWWSPRSYALFGVDPATFVPTPQSITALFHPEDRDEHRRRRAEAIAGRLPFFHELRVQRPDGSEVWLGHCGRAEYGPDGRPLRNFGVIMDVTDRKQAEQRLREADRQKDIFIAMLAHELRNPLAPIRSANYLLRRTIDATPRATWCMDVIERQVTQMSRLLDDLLDVSRLSRGQLKLQLEPLHLATVVARAIEVAQPVIDAEGHTLAVDMPAEPLVVNGDLTRLAQVFSNLLINAAKYTPRHGDIALRVQRRAMQGVVTVTDSGIGIAKEHLAQIFDVFRQVESARDLSQGGQGIGLSLARSLVELHGGSIQARSEGPGLGSEFEVRLTLAPDEGSHDGPPPLDAGSTEPTEKYRILVADDLRDTADSLSAWLQGLGHDVGTAYDGEAALQMAESIRPQVILLDLGMPKLSGYEVCKAVRAQPWGGRIVIIAQTGWGQQRDRQQTLEAGFDHHLVKPVEVRELAALLARLAPRQVPSPPAP